MVIVWVSCFPSNRAAVQRPEEILKLQPHKNEVKYCQYFDGGSKVASCSSASAKVNLCVDFFQKL